MEGSERERPLICLGEALVDLICPDPVEDPAGASRFEVHFGGALANVAVAAVRAGAPVALAGACGDDDWGRFLRDRLGDEGVSLDWHAEVEGLPTPFAFATLDRRREPTFRIQGDGIEDGIATLRGREDELVAAAEAVVVGSNTLVGEAATEVTLAVLAAARDAEVPVLFDPNLRPGRWADLDVARAVCLPVAAGATVLKCNLGEARWLVGDDGPPDEVARALVELGPRLVVVTAGRDGAIARGSCEAEVTARVVEMISPLGAGDCFMGTLAAGLLADDWRLDDVGEALTRAAMAGGEACTHLGTFE